MWNNVDSTPNPLSQHCINTRKVCSSTPWFVVWARLKSGISTFKTFWYRGSTSAVCTWSFIALWRAPSTEILPGYFWMMFLLWTPLVFSDFDFWQLVCVYINLNEISFFNDISYSNENSIIPFFVCTCSTYSHSKVAVAWGV